jgi:hypothetical protein
MAGFPISFSAIHSLWVGLIFAGLCGGIAVVQRTSARWSDILLGMGCLLLAIAAGGPMLNLRSGGSITVMVDLSPSTRGANFRDRDALDIRVHQLLGGRPYQILAFGNSNQPLPAGRQLPDLPVDQTAFTPPSTDAVVLFSDGQFSLPTTAPPTYPVIDPALDHPVDTAVSQLDINGQMVIATVTSSGPARSLHWTGAKPITTGPNSGLFTQYAQPTGDGEITAELSAGDLWPENDMLSIHLPPTPQAQRWWIGDSAPAGWRQMDASSLPADPADYLSTAVIVLDNIPADALSTQQQERLGQYVRDLGGGLIITGGDHAFAAGDYDGSVLESLSPLASSPPGPATHWKILIDGSGSMGTTDSAGQSPWDVESTAIHHLLPQLPPHDALSVGSFAQTLQWWSTGKTTSDTAALRLPPASAFPHGPTNLLQAFQQIIASDDGSTAAELLLMTDADTELPDPPAISSAMLQKKIRLHLLAIGHGSALPALQTIAKSTGGSVIEQLDPHQWITAAERLLKTALPARYEHQSAQVIFSNGPTEIAPEWNRTWLKPDANLLAKSAIAPMLATWQRGLGKVTSIAYPASPAKIETLARQDQSIPHDPRFSVAWQEKSHLEVTVDAIDHNQYLNGQIIALQLQDSTGTEHEEHIIPQTAPGRYQLSIESPRRPAIATVIDGSRDIARFALAGRYPREFDAIGNNYQNLTELARRTGGSVIPPDSIKPIDFRWPRHPIPLESEFAFAAFIAFAVWVIQQRR